MTEFEWSGAGRLAMAGLIVSLLAGCGEEQVAKGGKAQAGGPPPVDVARPIVKEVVEWDLFTGRFEAIERVEIRSRVSGYLQKVHFVDGQIVKKGDLLFTIDPRPFDAELARANSDVRRVQVALDLAGRELARAEKLLASRNISEETVDSRRAAKARAEAELLAVEAVARAARLNVEFTRIEAPVAGRISDAKIDVGNLISGGDAQSPVLAVVVALDPIYFAFNASEADYLKYSRLHQSGHRPSSREAANPVYVQLLDETGWHRKGKMDFVDNTFNTGSGTIRARAVLDNSDLLLVPGLFGRMRLLAATPKETLLLPDASVLADQSNRIVLVVGADGAVAARRVALGPVIDGLRVVRSGITPDDRVVVSGVQRARPGAKVTANEVKIDPSDGRIVPSDAK